MSKKKKKKTNVDTTWTFAVFEILKIDWFVILVGYTNADDFLSFRNIIIIL